MIRCAKSDRIQTRSCGIDDVVGFKYDHRDRPRPESGADSRRRKRPIPSVSFSCLLISNMTDQRIRRRSSLDRKNPLDRPGVGRIRSEAINGLSRKRDDATSAENVDGLLDQNLIPLPIWKTTD
jgi:hypothetical protein